MRMMPRLAAAAAVAVLVLAGPACGQAPDNFPVAEYVGKNKDEVDHLIGEVGACQKTVYGPKCYYQRGTIQIVYIDGKADWFTIFPPNLPFRESSISFLGLNDIKPTINNPMTIQWNKPASGMISILATPRWNGKIWYFSVKSQTP